MEQRPSALRRRGPFPRLHVGSLYARRMPAVPKLSLVIERRPVLDKDGAPTGAHRDVTVVDQIVEDLSVGMPVHRAAKRAGISPETFYEWERAAGRARAAIHANREVEEYDLLCIEFSNRVNAAELEWELRCNAQLEELSRGGIVVEKRVEKVDQAGNVLERTTTTSATLPDARVLLERLKLRFPKDYSDRVVIAGEGEGGAIPVEVRAAQLAAAAERHLAGSKGSRRKARRRLRARRSTHGAPELGETGSGTPGGASGAAG